MAEFVNKDDVVTILLEKQKELCLIGTFNRKLIRNDEQKVFDKLQEAVDAIEDMPSASEIPNYDSENKPLTINELRSIPANDWVWIEIFSPSTSQRAKTGYYKVCSEILDKKCFCCGWPGTLFGFEYASYEKAWVAYRTKP